MSFATVQPLVLHTFTVSTRDSLNSLPGARNHFCLEFEVERGFDCAQLSFKVACLPPRMEHYLIVKYIFNDNTFKMSMVKLLIFSHNF